ncbi:MAG: lipoyl synthase [Clostridioides sp.]|jgi:lipoic acid synthetase|nr:lipoyl synthase [Clostridioides sp.]
MEHLRKPDWLKIDMANLSSGKVGHTIAHYGLNTVCESAGCPNQGECYKSGTATFMLLGNQCTRNCKFCKVVSGKPEMLNESEPINVAKAASDMKLKHVVLTSVTRDDLSDGGSKHFANTIDEIHKLNPGMSIEVLIPDFMGDSDCLQTVIDAKPDIINHNVETIPSLYSTVRPEAIFERSIELLKRVRERSQNIFTKSGFMLGLGETEDEVLELLHALRDADVDIVTIGQYLQPTKAHLSVKEYIHPDKFEWYKERALEMGFSLVASGPLVRSSYYAADDFARLKQKCSL